jgi:hypothetical protein
MPHDFGYPCSASRADSTPLPVEVTELRVYSPAFFMNTKSRTADDEPSIPEIKFPPAALVRGAEHLDDDACANT